MTDDAFVPPPADGRVFRHPVAAGLADVAPSGRARLDAIARWLQDAALADVVDSGLDGGGVWVLRRLRLRVARFPRFGEALEVATFCSGTGALVAERRSTVRAWWRGRGAAVEALALWVHLDPDGAHPRPLPDGFEAVYGATAAGRRVRARLRHPAAPPDGAPGRPWRFRAADLDLAGHVNNAVYWQVRRGGARRRPSRTRRPTPRSSTARRAGPATPPSPPRTGCAGSARTAATCSPPCACGPGTSSRPMPDPLTAGCLCGAVRFEVTEPPSVAYYCHCTRCQRRTGTRRRAGRAGAARRRPGAVGRGPDPPLRPDEGLPKAFCGDCGSALWAESPRRRRDRGGAARRVRRGPGHPPELPPVHGLRRAVGADPGRRAAAASGAHARVSAAVVHSGLARPADGGGRARRGARAGPGALRGVPLRRGG